MDEALERLKQAYNFRADHAYVNFLLGYLYQKKEMKNEAIKHFEAFLQLAPNAPQVKDVKKLLENLKKKDENKKTNDPGKKKYQQNDYA